MTTPGRRRLLTGSLRARVTASATVAVVAVLAAAAVGLVAVQRSALVESVDETLAGQATVIAGNLAAGRWLDEGDLLSDDIWVEVESADGGVLAVPGPPGRLPAAAPADDRPRTTTAPLPGGEADVRLLVRQVDGSTIRVAGELEDVADITAGLVAELLVAIPLAAAVLAAIVWWAVGRALRPVEQLRARVDAIPGSRPDARVPEPGSPWEIDRLARTMNAMLSRVQRATEQQRRFVADAAHELRTPLARMRTELEVDRAHPDSANATATADSVLVETVGLQQLVEDLLLLARGDAGALDPDRRHPEDLDEVVRDVTARRRGHPPAIDVSRVRPVQVAGDRAQLERAVANLLDNAVRHAASRVTVTLEEHPAGTAELTVTDNGPGIPGADRERVFDRFTRLDGARPADGGAGLGLAIARGIAERHGGSLVLAPGTQAARFVLRLPAVDPPPVEPPRATPTRRGAARSA